jgi:uncharacterized membrane protein YcaP (DUF421 family)
MDLILRATVVFFAILIVTRAVGRRELGSLEPFDLILLIVIGDMVQQGITQSDYSVTGALLVICTLALLTVATSYVSFRFRRMRPLLEGQPLVLVEDGEIVDANLKRERITREELASEARQQQIASFEDIRFAVLETNGHISFIPTESGSGGGGGADARELAPNSP